MECHKETITLLNGGLVGSTTSTQCYNGKCRLMEIVVPNLDGTPTLTLKITSPNNVQLYTRASIAENTTTILPIREMDMLGSGSSILLWDMPLVGAGHVFALTKSATNQTSNQDVTLYLYVDR